MVEAIKLPEEVQCMLKDPECLKILTTTDEEGIPHTVVKGSMTILDDGTIAYAELLENSRTNKNILRMLNFEDEKRLVVINVFNHKTYVSYEIKGEPFQLEVDGPIWEMFLDKIWSILPDSDPTGVWLIAPREVRNQSYEARRKEEEERHQPPNSMWLRYIGKRP